MQPRHFLPGALLALWCAALSGVLLPFSPQALLALHLIGGIGGSVPLALFLSRHWWPRRHTVTRHPNAAHGCVALGCLTTLVLSGVALLQWTNVPALRWLHNGAMAVLMIDLSYHMAWRLRQRLRNPPPRDAATNTRKSPLGQWLVAALVASGAVGVVIVLTSPPAGPAQAAPVSVAHASLTDRHLHTAQACGDCHGDVTRQWRASAHGHAATDAYYQALATLFIEERGPDAARYCAACHNPIGLMQGEVDASAATRAPADGAVAYEARRLGVSLPISARAAEGVTCAVCHLATDVADPDANGVLRLDARAMALSDHALGQLSLRAAPEAHRQALMRESIRRAELCGSCHNLRSPDGTLALEPTFDEWKASPYAARGVTCQDCHMPAATARRVDSALPEPIAAHGGIPGAPSSLPALASDTTLLRSAAALDVSVLGDAAGLNATITVTNRGAGHYLPTGADDLRQVWLEVTARDASGNVVWSAGQLDGYGALPSGATRFGKVLGDAGGRPIDLHRFWVATQILSDTRLAPLEARAVAYRVPLASLPAQPRALAVRLLYRDVSQAFAEFALGRAVTDLPAFEMASAEVVLGE